jgi:preprotein translocase subunit YajC
MDPISLFMIAILGLLIYFMIRNSRKQRKTQEELAEKLKPGANVMTSFGLFGSVVSLDDDTNVAVLDVGKGVKLNVHRQTLTKVIDDEPVEVSAKAPAKSTTKKSSDAASEDKS